MVKGRKNNLLQWLPGVTEGVNKEMVLKGESEREKRRVEERENHHSTNTGAEPEKQREG